MLAKCVLKKGPQGIMCFFSLGYVSALVSCNSPASHFSMATLDALVPPTVNVLHGFSVTAQQRASSRKTTLSAHLRSATSIWILLIFLSVTYNAAYFTFVVFIVYYTSSSTRNVSTNRQ